jgi:hypothetical protein
MSHQVEIFRKFGIFELLLKDLRIGHRSRYEDDGGFRGVPNSMGPDLSLVFGIDKLSRRHGKQVG